MTVKLHTLTIGDCFVLNGVNYELAEHWTDSVVASNSIALPATLECVDMDNLKYVEVSTFADVEPQESHATTECPKCDRDVMTMDQYMKVGVCDCCAKGA